MNISTKKKKKAFRSGTTDNHRWCCFCCCWWWWMMIAHTDDGGDDDDDGQCSAHVQVVHSYRRNRLKRFPSLPSSFVYLVALVWLKCPLRSLRSHSFNSLTHFFAANVCWKTNAKQKLNGNGNCVQIYVFNIIIICAMRIGANQLQLPSVGSAHTQNTLTQPAEWDRTKWKKGKLMRWHFFIYCIFFSHSFHSYQYHLETEAPCGWI